MKKKQTAKARAVMPVVSSAVMLGISIWGFSTYGGPVQDAYAQDAGVWNAVAVATDGLGQEKQQKNIVDAEAAGGSDGRDDTGDAKSEATEDGAKADRDVNTDTKAGTGSNGSGNVPGAACTCRDKCTQYNYDTNCAVCAEDASRCAYKRPNVKITIKTPKGWQNGSAKVQVSVKDTVKSGNFTVQSIQAKTAQNGSWMDITEDQYVEISENSTVYVLVTDQEGRTYEKSRHITCFDFTKPAINAAVSDGLLSIRAYDTDSGVRAVYVNGYEFTQLTGGMLNIRLQQYDEGYQYFTMQALDRAGNMSEVYKTPNPYYTEPGTEESGEKTSEQLPVNVEATAPSFATARVTGHTVTDSSGNTVKETVAIAGSPSNGKKTSTKNIASAGKSKKGKEFYTIQTASDKMFYLVIERDGDHEDVHFLTDVSENDLLNVTTGQSETLPKNSAVLASAIPDSGMGNVVTGQKEDAQQEENTTDNMEQEDSAVDDTPKEENLEETGEEKESPVVAYVILAALAAAIIGGVYYLKSVRGKKEAFLDEEDDEEEEEIYEEDDGDEEEDADYADGSPYEENDPYGESGLYKSTDAYRDAETYEDTDAYGDNDFYEGENGNVD